MEQELLTKAIHAFTQETGISMRVEKKGLKQSQSTEIDATLLLKDTGARFMADIKARAARLNTGVILSYKRGLPNPEEYLLIGDYINPQLATRLKEANVQFIDTAGNAYIHRDHIHIFIKGNRKEEVLVGANEPSGKAFQPSGLKVTFSLMTIPGLINKPLRTIEHHALVALGSIGGIIQDLINQGFVEENMKTKLRKLVRTKDLLNKWTEEYAIKLKPKLIIGYYSSHTPDWYKGLDPVKYGAQWGGELAAKILTQHLNPKNHIVYLERENLNQFLKAARLQKISPQQQEENQIVVLKKFWLDNKESINKQLVPAALVYADLVATGDTRNLEAADRIHEQYLN